MTLRDEILARPDLSAAVVARDCAALADAMSVGRTRRKLVAIADIQARLQGSGAWWAIKGALQSGVTPAEVRAAAQAVMDVASARYDNVDMSIPLVAQMFGGLVAAGLLPVETLAEITAMSVAYDPLSPADVADALYNPDGTFK